MHSSSERSATAQREEDIFYSTYEPSKEDILEYAIKIGVHPDRENTLLYLARQGLLHPLPENWKPCYSKQVKAYYYYDRITKKSQWEHPIDVLYRAKVVDARKLLSLDKSESTSLGDSGFRSLKSPHNEAEQTTDETQLAICSPHVPNDFLFLQTVIRSVDSKACKEQERVPCSTAACCEQTGQTNEATLMYTNIATKEKEETSASNKGKYSQELSITTPANCGMGVSDGDMGRSSKVLLNFGCNEGDNINEDALSSTSIFGNRIGTSQHSFTITGTGSQFLKSNKKIETTGAETARKYTTEFKGILRDSSLQSVRSKSTQNEDSGSDERKSVRFDIDLNTDPISNEDKLCDMSVNNFKESEEAYDDNSDNQRENANEVTKHDENEIGNVCKVAQKQVVQYQLGRSTSPQLSIENDEHLNVPMDTRHECDKLQNRGDPGELSTSAQSLRTVASTYQRRAKPDDEQDTKSVRLPRQNNDYEQAPSHGSLEELRSLETFEETNLKIELAKLRHRYQDFLAQGKKEIEERHRLNIDEIKEFFEAKLNEMKSDYEEENVKEYNLYVENKKKEFDQRVRQITDEHRTIMATLQKNHNEIVEELDRDLKTEEELLKKEHVNNLTEMKIKLDHEIEIEKQRMRETGEDRLYEKVRCEKRLLEDKYKCLKEKYTRLKTDVRISLERRKKRREQQQHSLLINRYDDTEERSHSKPVSSYRYNIGNNAFAHSSGHSGLPAEKSSATTPPTSSNSKRFSNKGSLLENKHKPIHYNEVGEFSNSRKEFMINHNNNINNTNNNSRVTQTEDTSLSEATYSKNYFQIRNMFASIQHCEGNISSDSEFDKIHCEKVATTNSARPLESVEAAARPKRKVFTKTKSASTSRLNATKHDRDGCGGRPCTPVENLRIQLKKLEELEDQIPDCNLDAPYHLRYPFVIEQIDDKGSETAAGGFSVIDGVSSAVRSGNSNSELEFFKHRVLLERDSVMRAKESLRAQKNLFKSKQHDISIKHVMKNKHTMDQMFNEEKELTEMEVSLHRTRALLGEKVIRLRYLERSLLTLSEKECPKFHSENIERVPKPKEMLSDLSSYSSSGFSSNDMPTSEHNNGHFRTTLVARNVETIDAFHYLEDLHADINEIWGLLKPCISSASTSFDEIDFLNNTSTITGNTNCDKELPPTPSTTISNKSPIVKSTGKIVNVQTQSQHHHITVNLLKKTRNLKNWLRHAKTEHEMLKKGAFD